MKPRMAVTIRQHSSHISDPIPEGPEATILLNMKLIDCRRRNFTKPEVVTSWTMTNPCSVSLNMSRKREHLPAG